MNTVKSPLSSLLTNGHLLLPDTIFGHGEITSNFQSWSAGCGGRWCMTCVFSMPPQCLLVCTQWLHPLLASPRIPSLLFADILYDYTQYTVTGIFSVTVPCCPDKRGFTVLISCRCSICTKTCVFLTLQSCSKYAQFYVC